MATKEEGMRLLSELMEGDFDGLDEIAERLKDENPLVKEQIDEFLESLEELRMRAEESGEPIPPLEQLGDMQILMKRVLETGRMSPREESE